MTRHILLTAVAATLFAAGLQAQDAPRECPGGPADADGLVISVPLAVHPTRAADMVDSVLVRAGYRVRSTPQGVGEWSIVPRFTFVDGLKEEVMEGLQHPGVQIAVRSSLRSDSTLVEVGARAICLPVRNGAPDPELQTAIAAVHAIRITGALDEELEALVAAGVDLQAPVERARQSVMAAPAEVAGFRLINRHDYDDPRAGVNVRYGREDGSYVDVYVYPGPPSACDAACGAEYVNEEADGFIQAIPEMVASGAYGRMEVRGDERIPAPAGAAWLFGRHVEMDVELRGEARDSHFYLFAYPGYKVKVRATYPPSEEMTAAVRAFVDALLPAMASKGG